MHSYISSLFISFLAPNCLLTSIFGFEMSCLFRNRADATGFDLCLNTLEHWKFVPIPMCRLILTIVVLTFINDKIIKILFVRKTYTLRSSGSEGKVKTS